MTDQQLQIVRAVWAKGSIVPQYDANLYRVDVCGTWMSWQAYGNRDSQYGWEIDHATPVARGGSDAIGNLRPLHWKNNARKSDGALACAVSARG